MTDPRLHSVVIDVPRTHHARAVAFWSAAFGQDPVVSDTYADYAQYADITPGCNLLVQATDDADSRVHLDFETTDVAAAVARISAAGAEVLNRDNPWTVMRDPAGHPFCICPSTGCME